MRTTIFISLILISTSAFGYVGPGLGLGVIGALLGAIATVLLAIFGVVWYPLKRMLKRKNESKESKDEDNEPVRQDNREGDESD